MYDLESVKPFSNPANADVFLTSLGIQLVPAIVQEVSSKHIEWPAHLVFDDLAYATTSLIFEPVKKNRFLHADVHNAQRQLVLSQYFDGLRHGLLWSIVLFLFEILLA